MAEECVKRDYGAQQCVFLPCPNLCGVTCKRGLMEDHMAKCRLEEVVCEFTGVGCDAKFNRKEQREHSKRNTHKHLTITAAAAVKMKEQLHEQEQRSQQQILKLENTLQTLEQVIKLQEKKIEEMEQKFEQLLKESDQNKVALKEITECIDLKRTFEMENFSKEKAKDEYDDWYSPAMYTHVGGYKFCIGIDANGYGDGHGKAIHVNIWAMPGKYDHQLKWPAQATFTIELLHQQRGQNVQHTITEEWSKPDGPYTHIGVVGDIEYGGITHFIAHYSLSAFLCNDILYFHVTKITI